MRKPERWQKADYFIRKLRPRLFERRALKSLGINNAEESLFKAQHYGLIQCENTRSDWEERGRRKRGGVNKPNPVICQQEFLHREMIE